MRDLDPGTSFILAVDPRPHPRPAMPHPLHLALRFARGWSNPPRRLTESEFRIETFGEGDPVAGTLLAPAGSGPLPGWVVLHGITRKGRRHPMLLRFTRALAGTGARVLIPEVPEWVDLDLAPARAHSIVRGAVRTLATRGDVEGARVALTGFSFGGPQALLAASMADEVRGVLAWGSYADLERTVDFHFTGEDEFDEAGVPGRVLRPDPYGRWVVGANCLPLLEGELTPVARALHALAARAGDLSVDGRSPELEGLREEIRGKMTPSHRELLDLFAPPEGRRPERSAALELSRRMTAAARQAHPLLDPIPNLAPIPVPVRLLHGRDDLLIPYTETLALARALHDRTSDLKTGITGLFAHSRDREDAPPGGIRGMVARSRDALHFLGMLSRAFEIVRA